MKSSTRASSDVPSVSKLRPTQELGPSPRELRLGGRTPLAAAREGAELHRDDYVALTAWRARGTADDSPDLRAIGARAALATDCADEAIAFAGDTSDPELLHVILRAHLLRDRWSEAATIAQRPEITPDDEIRSIVRVAHAAEGLQLWQVSGTNCAETPRRPEAPVPVIGLTVNGRPALALLD